MSAAWTWPSVATQALLLATAALSWNLVAGYLGRVDLGQVAYAGLGAYGAAVTATGLGWPAAVSVVAGTVVAVAAAAAVGPALLRLTGPGFAIATLGLLVATRELVRLLGPVTGGGRGVVLPPLPPGVAWVAAVALFAAALTVSWRLRRGVAGAVLHAIRADEVGAAVRGVRTGAWTRGVYAAAAGLTGTAGALWAYQSTFIDPDLAFADSRTLDAITATVLGGLGSVAGPVLGALVLVAGHAVLGLPSDAWQLLLQGAVLLGLVRWLPRGLAGLVPRRATRSPQVPPSGLRPAPSGPPPPEPGTSPEPQPPPSGPPVLEVRGLRTPDDGGTVLTDVDLTIRPGEILGVLGPNGSGKTTLADCLGRLRPVSGGSIRLAGRDVTRDSPGRVARAGLGRTFQRPRIHRGLTVADHLRLRGAGGSGGGRADGSLARLGLEPYADVAAGELDAGRQRLLELGLALLGEPRVLVLDEAAAGVPADLVPVLTSVVRACAAQGVAVVVIEHDVGLVADLCHRVVVLDRGRLVASGPPASVLASGAVETAYIGCEG